MQSKELIKFRFKKNLETYDNCAVVQKAMAKILCEKICEFCGGSFEKIFEFGAGTGFLTKNILGKISFSKYCANDITEESQAYVKQIIRDVEFLTGDIEKLETEEKFDLIVSNAVVQWISDIDELILKMRARINYEGCFAFTTFGEKNYTEIKETTGLSLNYLKSATLREICEKYFDVVFFEEDVATLYFDSPVDVLKHIKHSGTNGLKPLSWTFSKLKNFEDFYRENFCENGKVKLTYNPVYVVLKAKMD